EPVATMSRGDSVALGSRRARAAARLGAHSAAQDDWVVAAIAQHPVEELEVCGALREDEAVPIAVQCGAHVVDDLPVPRLVVGKVAVYGGHPARRGGVG